MTLIPYINPLSSESQKIVSTEGNLDALNETSEDLVSIASSTHNQSLDAGIIPTSLNELALKRIQWYIERSNNKDFKQKHYSYLFNTEIIEYDVLSFHMLAQAIAFKFNLTSRETKLFLDSQKQLILDRLNRLLESERTELIEILLQQLDISTGVNWTILKDVIDSRKLSLTELVLNQGEIVIDLEEFEYLFEDELDNRRPEIMYDLLIGEDLKEKLISTIIMQNTQKPRPALIQLLFLYC